MAMHRLDNRRLIQITISLIILSQIYFVYRSHNYSCETHYIETKESRLIKKIRSVGQSPQEGGIKAPAVIAKIAYGFGNQLFQFASSYALARQLNVPLYLIIPENPGTTEDLRNPGKREYALDAFNLESFEIDIYKIGFDAWEKKNDGSMALIEEYLCINFFFDRITETNKLLNSSDFCHSEKYFEEYSPEIRGMLKFSQSYFDSISSPQFFHWKDQIRKIGDSSSSPTTGIHIRRGDYLKKENWITPLKFYEKAVSKIVEKYCDRKVPFFIFTDDIDYVKANFSTSFTKSLNLEKNCSIPDFHYVSTKLEAGNHELTNLEEFVLMTLCENLIISTSTFSWWAAYLMSSNNPNKTVIGPTFHPEFLKHLEDEKQKRFKTFMWTFKYPDEWITIDPFDGIGL